MSNSFIQNNHIINERSGCSCSSNHRTRCPSSSPLSPSLYLFLSHPRSSSSYPAWQSLSSETLPSILFMRALLLSLKCVMGAGRSWLGGRDTHICFCFIVTTVINDQFDVVMNIRTWHRLHTQDAFYLCTSMCVKSIAPLCRDDRLQPIWLQALKAAIARDVPAFHKHWERCVHARSALHFPWLPPAANQMPSWLFYFLVSTDRLKATANIFLPSY